MSLTFLTRLAARSAAEQQAWQLQQAKLYVEAHLAEPFTVRQLADASHYSYHRFHHLFTTVEQESVGSFVQRARLERGAYLLRHAELLVATIAEAVGYASGAAFSKAFTHYFGVSPSAYRAARNQLPVTGNHGGLRNYAAPRLVRVQPRRLLCARQQGAARHEQAWVALAAAHPDNPPPGATYFGKTPDFPGITPARQLRYDACLLLPTTGPLPPNSSRTLHTQTLEGGRFAVLQHHGSSDQLAASFQAIYQNWLPESGYRLRNATWYQQYGATNELAESVTDIYVPIE